MVEIRRIGVVSFALMTALIYVVLGLIFGLLFACLSLVGLGAIASNTEELLGLSGGTAVMALIYAICLPLVYGVLGFIGGAIVALVYNLVAGFAGGVQVELRGGEAIPKMP
jgi:hypothetical protein